MERDPPPWHPAASLSHPAWLAGHGLGWRWDVPHRVSLRFWFPLAALAFGLLLADHLTPTRINLWAFLVVYHSPFGMYTGMPAALALGMSPVFVILLVLHLHVFGGLFLVWNMDWLKALPWLGTRVARMEAKGRAAWDRRPRLRSLGVLGLAIYVFIPVTVTGLVTGSILGRMLGIPWFPTLVAVVLGGMARIVLLVLVAYAGWRLTPWG